MRFIWPESARAQLRAMDREIAIRILHALTEYGESGAGDVKALAGQWQGHFDELLEGRMPGSGILDGPGLLVFIGFPTATIQFGHGPTLFFRV